jgi:NADH-quinone oxidoreductase subunit L
MNSALFLIPAFPFAGFLILALLGRYLPRRINAIIGAGSIGASALLALIIGYFFIAAPGQQHAITQTLWSWMQFDGYTITISFLLDQLSLVMVLVITFVGFLIHVYSAEFMQNDEGHDRFFAYMNLFVASMLTLVLADNLVLLYLGWEGVGLCSYLLIGFWYRDPINGSAARKAFITTRTGDTALALGIFLLFTQLHTLNIQDLMHSASLQWTPGSGIAVLAAALLLGGALGKSAQLPLQVWLPDAMAGPTPVSALIHAATMVTAGVYLIARTHVLFELAPQVQAAVAVIGALTLLIAGFSALAQHDIKRILAYSTISQIGYMFLALGVGAWSSAVFHFMTHAFFKALLFLGAGVMILAQHEEHDIFKMGGLKAKLPTIFWTFLIGAASLSALPIVTAGFYSKDEILWQAWSSPSGGLWLWLAGLVGAFITSLYTFRMVFVTFYGESKTPMSYSPGSRMQVPLVILAVFSIFAGFINLPVTFGKMAAFSDFLVPVFGKQSAKHAGSHAELMLQMIESIVSLAGIATAYLAYLQRLSIFEAWQRTESAKRLHRFFFSGGGFDKLYDTLLLSPFLWLVKTLHSDFIDAVYTGIARVNQDANSLLVKTQTGNIRWYAMAISIGAVVFLGIVIFLT